MATQRRRIIREKVLQALYAYEISREPIALVIGQQLGELQSNHSEFRFASSLVEQVIQHEEELDKIIRSKVTNWEFERVATIDKIILRMGISELIYFADIPPKVTINEAIEIAKEFSTDKSGHFVNGVLDAILMDLKAGNKLNKAGRGLLDESPHTKQADENPSQLKGTE